MEIIEKYYYPILAYSNEEESSKEKILEVWDKFDLLTEKDQDIVSSIETAKKIKVICQKNNFNANDSRNLSRIIRNYCFNEISISDLPRVFLKEIGIDFGQADTLSDLIVTNILNSPPIQKELLVNLEKISISDALKKYPEIGEQLVTSTPINLKSFPEPVRPSIKNWISDYMFNVGIANHDQMIRTNYLFRNINTVRLSSDEREKLTQVIKSFDENTPVAVDPTKKQVLFEKATSDMRHETREANSLPQRQISNTLANKQENRPNYNLGGQIKPVAKSEDEYVNERLSNWRKDFKQETRDKRQESVNSEQNTAHPAPTKASQDTASDIPNTNISFSSAQKLPIEKKKEPIQIPKPQTQSRKVYSNPPIDLSNITLTNNNPAPSSKNVVNLKEN